MAKDILERTGLKFEDLQPNEKETYFQMMESLKEASITPSRLLDYIQGMKYEVEEALIKEPEYKRIFIFKFLNREQVYLKARLRNYMLLEAFLLSPEKARKQIEAQIQGAFSK